MIDNNSFPKMMLIIEAFACLPGLKVNMAKSQLLGINMEEEGVGRLADNVGCVIGTWSMSYLGMPLSGKTLGGRIFGTWWWPKFPKGWRDGRAFLSRGGRLALIKLVLEHMPTYFLFYLPNPKRGD